MKFSYSWLHEHIDGPLPTIEKIAETLSFKSMEVEGVEGDILDVKVLPNRAHDCLSHRGLAREISAILDLNNKERDIKVDFSNVSELSIKISDNKICPRYIAVKLENIEVKKSPKWVSDKLESIGQRSISNIVDVTNFVMNDLGQPMHAFDADKVKGEIIIRTAKKGESLMTLDKKELILKGTETVIADEEGVLALAGIKGGVKAEVTSSTTKIILESANFNQVLTRLTSNLHNLKTDASKRFEAGLTSELALEGMQLAISLLKAENENIQLVAFKDLYPKKEVPYAIGLSVSEVNGLLGSSLKLKEINSILTRVNCQVLEVNNPRAKVVETSKSLVGKKYKRGASVLYDAPKTFDCSSFTSWVFLQSGIVIPRVSIDQFAYSKEINASDLKPGDIIFTNTQIEKSITGKHYSQVLDLFVEEKPSRNVTLEFISGMQVSHYIDHVGIYVGDGQIVHATSDGNKVVMEELEISKQFQNEIFYRSIILDDSPRLKVTVPTFRKDLKIKEDLIEEVGRIIGYEKIPSILPSLNKIGIPHKRLYYETKIKNILFDIGYSEIYTYTFGSVGELEILKALAQDKNKLRTNLGAGVLKALEMNQRNAPLLGVETIKIFEFGNVFTNSSERRNFSLAVDDSRKRSNFAEEVDLILVAIKKELGTGIIHYETISTKPYVIEIDFDSLIDSLPEPASYEPLKFLSKDIKYSSVSSYPFIARDVAVWSPRGKNWEDLEKLVMKIKNPLIVRVDCFDTFTKIGDDGKDKTSFAFRVVLQSNEKTLTDEEANIVTSEITEMLNKNKYTIR